MKQSILFLFIFLIGILASIIMVATGFDAAWFSYFQNTSVATFFSLAGIVGFIMPVLSFITLLVTGYFIKNARLIKSAWVVAWAGFLGFSTSTFLKIFTGRIPPPQGIISSSNVLDLSHGFRFGILHGGVFWGWPSSHTATAFAMSVALLVFYREKKWVKYLALAYAGYIALGASMSFHWASDVVVGVILGSIIGIVIGRFFREKFLADKK